MKNIFIISMMFLFVSRSLAQQTPMFSQYMFNMLNINPAYTGNRENPNLTMLFRNQWVGFPGAPKTGSVSFDDRVNDRNHSWGGQMYYETMGIEKASGIQGFYSFSAPFNNATLSLGMSFGVLNYRIDYNRTNPYDAGDPSLQNVINAFLPTTGLGALLSGERWYVGLSSPALLKTKISSQNQAIIQRAGAEGHYFLTGGYVVPLSDDVVVKPSVLLKAVSGVPIQTDYNLNVWFNDVVGVGGSYRTGDAILGMLELRLKQNVRLGYSYDHNISDLVYYNGGSHEFMLRYELGGAKGKKVVSPRYF